MLLVLIIFISCSGGTAFNTTAYIQCVCLTYSPFTDLLHLICLASAFRKIFAVNDHGINSNSEPKPLPASTPEDHEFMLQLYYLAFTERGLLAHACYPHVPGVGSRAERIAWAGRSLKGKNRERAVSGGELAEGQA